MIQPACSHCGSTHASRGRWKTPLNDRDNPAVLCFNARRCQQRKRRAEKHAGQLELALPPAVRECERCGRPDCGRGAPACNTCCGSTLGRDPEDNSCMGCG